MSISGMLIGRPRRSVGEGPTIDAEDSPDCIEILPDGRYVAEYGPDEWYEVDPVTNEPDFDQPLDPESIPSSLRETGSLD